MEPDVGTSQSVESASSLLVVVAQLRRLLGDVMRVDGYEVLKPPEEVIAFRGRVIGDTEVAFEQIEQRFAQTGYAAWLRERPGGGHEVVAVRGSFSRQTGRAWVNLVLLAVTFFSVLYIGAQYALQDIGLLTERSSEIDLLIQPLLHLHQGIPFAATLLGILLAHELSHYFVARRYGSPVSLPYFIPMPFSIIGTMGAVIVQRAPMRNRKALFDIGVAGPLGGLLVAIPLLVLGLSLSTVGSPPPGVSVVMQEGNSLLYLALKFLVFGRILPSHGEDVWLNSVAFAAWAGLLITMINLVPVGQLDGGHISYALLGRRAWELGYALIGLMIVWGGWLVASGNEAGGFWIMWALVNLFLNRRHPPPVDDATKVDRRRLIVGVLMAILFVLLFMPSPLRQIVL